MNGWVPDWLPSKQQTIERISSDTDENYWRFLYWQQITETFMSIAGFESAIINAMTMCDQIAVNVRFGPDDSEYFRWMKRRGSLESSTLGNLINLLERHEFKAESIAYLRWVKSKREYFIQQHFMKTPWPANLEPTGCYSMIRRLIYIEKTMDRAALKMWKLFEREGLLVIEDLGNAGAIVSSSQMWVLD